MTSTPPRDPSFSRPARRPGSRRAALRGLAGVGLLVPFALAAAGPDTVDPAAPGGIRVPGEPASNAGPDPDPRPNLVLIVADDLGWGDLSCFGQENFRTPNLDRLAAEGLRLRAFFAGSTVCAPSRAVLMTGQHTGHTRIRGNRRLDLLDEEVTLAERLLAAGYHTGAFGKWGLGHEGTDGLPTRQGFDAFFGFLDQAHAHNSYPHFLIDGAERSERPNVVPKPNARGAGVASEKREWAPEAIHRRALDWLAEVPEPFFLYLPSTIPHANNEAGREGLEVDTLGAFAEREDWPVPARRYAALVTRLDEQVGEVLAALEARGLTERTLVVFTSDNGPHREGGNDPTFHRSSGPWRGIKRSLHDGGVRVPTVVRWPGEVPAGSVSDRLGWFPDLVPTLCAAAGVAPGTEGGREEELDGVDLLPLWRGHPERVPGDRTLFWEFHEGRTREAVRTARWKLVREPMGDGTVTLHDLLTDPAEQRDVAGEHPEVVRDLLERLEASRTPSEIFGR